MRRRLARWVSRSFEPLIEWTIRLCGWSAIFFVFGILFFVFREAAPALTGGLNLKEFFTSQNWRPDSTIQPQFGILALMAGAAAVALLAMGVAGPGGVGAGVFLSPDCPPGARGGLETRI